MRSSKSLGLLFSVGLAGSLVLAACGSGGATTSGSGTAATGGAGAAAGSSGGVGNFVFAKLKFDDTAIGTPGTADSAIGVDGTADTPGMMLDGPQFPNGGKKATDTWTADNGTKVPFAFPGSTGMNAVGLANGADVKIAVTPGKYSAAYILESVGNGPATGDVTPTYSGGAGAQQQMPFDDWCNGTPDSGVIAFQPTDRLDATGTSATPACGLFIVTVKLDGSKSLSSLDIMNDSSSPAKSVAVIPAVTLQKA